MITREWVMENLRYEPDTGLFWWKVSAQGRKMDRPAGTTNYQGRRILNLRGRLYKATRLAHLVMAGTWPEKAMDHINGNCLDDRWANLRAVSPSDNNKNAALRSTNKSGFHGIKWDEGRARWHAKIGSGKKQIFLGRFLTLEEAVSARRVAEQKYEFHDNHGRTGELQ